MGKYFPRQLIPEEENTSDTTVEDDGGSLDSSEKVDDSGVIEV